MTRILLQLLCIEPQTYDKLAVVEVDSSMDMKHIKKFGCYFKLL